MRRTLFFATLMLAIAPAVRGWEHREPLSKREGEDPRFTLTALRHKDGAVLVKFVVPAQSPYRKCSCLRLEVEDKGVVLLWTKLATSETEKGDIVAGFQIHDSLAQKAYIAFAWDGDEEMPFPRAKLVRIMDYITDWKPKPAGS